MSILFQYLRSKVKRWSADVSVGHQTSSILRTGGIGAALSVALGLGFLLPWGTADKDRGRLAELSYDIPFRFRPAIELKTNDVCCVYMDDVSMDRLGQQRQTAWDRSLHAELVDRLRECGARVIAFDVSFRAPGDPQKDEALIKAVKAHGRVVVGAYVGSDFYENRVIGTKVYPPFEQLMDACVYGVAVAEGDGSESIRKHYFAADLKSPGMAYRVAELAMTNPPADPYLPRWINYYGPPGTIPGYSYWEVHATNGPVACASFSNKVVFVGARYNVAFHGGKIDFDDFSTPYTRSGYKSPGVEVAATTYLNLVNGDWLVELSPVKEFLLVIVCGLGFGFGLAALRPFEAAMAALTAMVALAVLAVLLLWQAHLWFPWLILAVVQIPVAAVWSALTHSRRVLAENRSLEQRLALASGGGQESEPGSPLVPERRPPPVLAVPGGLPPIDPRGAPPTDVAPVIPDHTLLSCIGKGAYGEIWLARDIIGTYHAVKVVYRHTFPNSVPYEREFKGIKHFTPISRSHPGFVQILHVGRSSSPEFIYYIMEIGDDEKTAQEIDPDTYTTKNLAKEIKRLKRLPVDDCIRMGVELADALEYLHQQNLVHRDIKPSNIIFVGGKAKFADIGLVTEIATQHSDVSYLGTHGYIAPEGPGRAPADVYGLGKVIYEAVFGLAGDKFPEIPTTLIEAPDEDGTLIRLNRVILRACEERVHERYQSARELHAALLALQPSGVN